jgi:hypothetical protein
MSSFDQVSPKSSIDDSKSFEYEYVVSEGRLPEVGLLYPAPEVPVSSLKRSDSEIEFDTFYSELNIRTESEQLEFDAPRTLMNLSREH